jgi:hypothetical protein
MRDFGWAALVSGWCIVWIGRILIAQSPVWRIAIVAIEVADIALIHQLRVIMGSTGDPLSGLIDIDCIGRNAHNRVHREQELRRPQPEEAPGRHLEKAHFVLPFIDEQVIDLAQLLVRHIQGLSSSDIFAPVGER